MLDQLSQLDRPLLEHAVDRDLIHPDLSRTEVEELRRTMTIAGDPVEMVAAGPPAGTTPELAQIDERLAELKKEVRALTARRQKLVTSLRRARPSKSGSVG